MFRDIKSCSNCSCLLNLCFGISSHVRTARAFCTCVSGYQVMFELLVLTELMFRDIKSSSNCSCLLNSCFGISSHVRTARAFCTCVSGYQVIFELLVLSVPVFRDIKSFLNCTMLIICHCCTGKSQYSVLYQLFRIKLSVASYITHPLYTLLGCQIDG